MLEAEKEKDIGDLMELLKQTHVQVSENDMINKNLIQLAKNFKLNLDIPGNKDYNPLKPDLKQIITEKDKFSLSFAGLCSKDDAFQRYKENVRDTLGQNKEHKQLFVEKRRREIAKTKLAVKLHSIGIEHISYLDLKGSLDLDLISKLEFEQEKQRRSEVFMRHKTELAKTKLFSGKIS